MYCIICGSKVNDDAVFCTKCGNKIQRQNGEPQVQMVKKTVTATPVLNKIPEAVPVVRPVQEITNVGGQLAAKNKEEVVPVNISIEPVTMPRMDIPQIDKIAPNQGYMTDNTAGAIGETKKTKTTILPFVILSLIFAALTVFAGACEIINVSSGVKDVALIIEIFILVIICVVYLFNNNKVVGTLKAIGLLFFIISDLVFVGFDSIKYGIDGITSNASIIIADLNNVSVSVVKAYFISILVWYGFLYLFCIVDGIRAVLYTRKAKLIAALPGIISIAGVVVSIVTRALIEGQVLTYFLVPVNSVYIFLILTIVFGIMSKKKIGK